MNPDLGKYESIFKENPELLEYILNLEEKVNIDELTGLYNFRHYQKALETEFERAKRFSKRSPHPLSLILGDIDNFKYFNDTHGHDEGNNLLKHLGYTIRTHVRKIDIPCRYGGEEFAVITPETGLPGAKKLANVLREHIERMGVRVDNKLVPVTMSFGIGTYPCKDVVNSIGLLNIADSALYHAKNTGRNRVCTYEDLRSL